MVDSGNLLQDPTDMSPVMLIKEKEVSRLFPELSSLQKNLEEIPQRLKKRIRFIPISTSCGRGVLCAVRPECVYLISGNKRERLSVTVAIDNEGGSYGGYSGLMPASAIDNIKC